MNLATVTLVFTDLVGSTELASRVGPGAAETLRREHFALLRQAFHSDAGREVKSLGDGLMLVFDSPSNAVEAAVAAQQAIEIRNRRAEVRFEVRIGVALGEVNREDDDYFGEAVVAAARLCALADGGQVLVTDIVKLLAESGCPHDFHSVGALELKGLPDPVPAHEVVWTPVAGEAWPLPQRLRGAPEAVYVGRGEQRKSLDDAWKAACAGRGSLVLLSGEPGIGKSRLAAVQAFTAHEEGGTVLFGAVDEGLGVPYQPWIESLGHYVENCNDAVLKSYVDTAGPALTRLVPALARRVPDLPPMASSDGETERYLLIEAVTRLIRDAAADRPVLIVLDDLHWADSASLRLLAHVSEVLADSAVLIVGAYRDTDLTSEHPLTDVLATLRRRDRVTWINLKGLEQSALEELLRHASGQEQNADTAGLAKVLQRDTNGNPLFVGEVLRHLMESGLIGVGADGQWGLTTDLEAVPAPDSVRDVVLQRVQRLGAEAHRVLATAALIGLEFDVDLLAAVLERPADDLIDILDAATTTSLTGAGSRAGRLRFIHALVAQALVDGLSPLRRSQLHRAIAGAVESLHGPELGDRFALVARHLVAAGDDPAKAIDYARRAGQHALAALAPEEAMRWFRTALDLLGTRGIVDEQLRCDLIIDIGEASRDSGIPGHRDTFIEAAHLAESLDDGDRLARAVLAMNRSMATSFGTTDHELVAVMEAALEHCTEPGPTRALLLVQLAAELIVVAPLARRQALVEEAISIARDVDDATTARVLISGIPAVLAARTMTQQQALVAELERLLPRIRDPHLRTYAALHSAMVALGSVDRAGLDRWTVRAREAGADAVQPAPRWFLSWMESVVAVADGDLARADRFANESLELAMSTGIDDGMVIYGGLAMGIYFPQGRFGELLDMIRQGAADNPQLGDVYRVTMLLALVEAEQLDEASEVLDALLADIDVLPENVTWAGALSCMSIAANRCQRPEAAAALHEVMSTTPHDRLDLAGPACSSHTSTILGLLATTLGRRDEADAHFTFATEHLADFEGPLLLAYNLHEHGRALSQLGDPADRERARDLLHRAASMWREHDCPIQAQRCEDLLADLV